MSYTPTVSVILPNYCHARYLDQRIQSILEQSYQDFELIILDDCSPDEGASKAVIEKYRGNEHVSHIIYNETNSGSTFRQWHKGFDLARGKFIWIAESDDYCEPTMLETLINKSVESPSATLLYVNSLYVDSEGKTIEYYSRYILGRQRLFDSREYASIDFIKKYMAIGCGVPNASACIFKKSVIQGMPLDYMNYKAAGDRLFWIHVAEKGSVVFVTKPLNYFRQHDNKVSPKKLREGITHEEDLKICQYINKQGYLTALQKHLTWCSYIKSIYLTDFDTEDIKKRILSKWRKDCDHGFLYTSLVCKIMYKLKRLHLEFF